MMSKVSLLINVPRKIECCIFGFCPATTLIAKLDITWKNITIGDNVFFDILAVQLQLQGIIKMIFD